MIKKIDGYKQPYNVTPLLSTLSSKPRPKSNTTPCNPSPTALSSNQHKKQEQKAEVRTNF